MTHFSIIAAIDAHHGIGRDNHMPWQLSDELRHFKSITTHTQHTHHQNAVIMGRHTWESIPKKYRPLVNRYNIVLRSQPLDTTSPPSSTEAAMVSSLESAFALCSAMDHIDQVFIIGGASVYRQAIQRPDCQRLYITHIMASYDCDTFFPDYNHDYFLTHQDDIRTENGVSYYYAIYDRNPS